MSSKEWLDSTPRMIQELMKRRLKRIQREEFMMSTIASTVANFSICRPEPPLKQAHFMMNPEPERPITGEEIMAIFGHKMPDK